MYRIGRKQKRALLTNDGILVALFEKGQEELAELTCRLLNEQCNIADVVGQSEQLVCETCGEVEVKEQGDWCDKCLGIEPNEAN